MKAEVIRLATMLARVNSSIAMNKLKDTIRDLRTTIDDLNQTITTERCWRTDAIPPIPEQFVVEFHVDRGLGHGHFEMHICTFDPAICDFVGYNLTSAGIPSIVRWIQLTDTHTTED